jgi:hypothetical protein
MLDWHSYPQFHSIIAYEKKFIICALYEMQKISTYREVHIWPFVSMFHIHIYKGTLQNLLLRACSTSCTENLVSIAICL